ncbi:hypothetical protein [Bifidobacterium xylocopae]|nr:hypothetical protein [Bifidobacterium xylocopae]
MVYTPVQPAATASDYLVAAQPGDPDGMGKTQRRSLIVAVVAVVVAALVAALLVLRPWAPSPADYRMAADSAVDMHNQSNKISEQLVSAYDDAGHGGFSAHDAGELKRSIDKFDRMNKDFASQKALKDKDVAARYQAYMVKSRSYGNFSRYLADSAPIYSRASQSCKKVPDFGDVSDTKAYMGKVNDYVSTCKTDLDQLAKAPDKVLADYAGQASTVLGKMQDLLKQVSDLVDHLSADNLDQSMDKMNDLEDQEKALEGETPKSTDISMKLLAEERKANPDPAYLSLHQALEDKAKR